MFGSTVQWRRGINVLVLATVTGVGAMAQTPAPPASREQLLETHMKDEKSGSAAAGRPVYDKLCAGCHRFGAIGKDVGPDLTTLTSRFKRRDILEDLETAAILSEYGVEVGVRAARKHLDWYLEAASLPISRSLRKLLLESQNPSEVIGLVEAIFAGEMREAA